MMTHQHQILQQTTEHSSPQSPQSIADYLAQLLKDRKQLAALPNVFTHLERLLDEGKTILKDSILLFFCCVLLLWVSE